MADQQLARLADVAIADLTRIRAGIARARVVLADTDDAAETARQSLTALRDTVKADP